MDLFERISRLKPEQQKLLELTLIRQGVDIRQIPITGEYGKNHPHYPLALEQEPMWIIEKLDPDNPSYDAPGTVSLEGNLDLDTLEKSINEVVKRHNILRAVFITDREKPAQVILPSLILPLEHIDLKDLPGDEQENRMKQLREDSRLYRFDLAGGPLLKTLLVGLGQGRYIFITIMHHIIGDLFSLKIFLKEVAWFYTLYSQGQPPAFALPRLSFQYVDYACWQRHWYRESLLGSETLKRQEPFWLEMFKAEVPVLNLPSDYPRPVLKSYEGAHGFFSVKGEKLKVLKDIFIKENTTLYVVLLSIFYVFLAKISGQEDIVVGTPVNTRQDKSLKDMIGLFVKTLPLRNYPRGDKTFKEFLSEVNTRVLNLFKNQDYSYEELVRKNVKERDASRNPLFDVLFNFIYIDMSEIEMPGLKVQPYRLKPKRVGFDLELVCEGTYEELFFKLSYCTKLFKEETVNRFISYFRKVLTAVLTSLGLRICQIGIIPGEEQEQVLFAFNNTTVNFPRQKTTVEWVEEQVEKTPDHAAAVFADQALSYRALQETYRRLAVLLQTKGVGPEVIVGLMAARSLEMLVGLLGILQAGGAYLPIDPTHPGERLTYILADSNSRLLVTAVPAEEAEKLKRYKGEKIDLKPGRQPADPIPPPQRSTRPNPSAASLAYVIYTSGSTGKPKGVAVTHRNVINFMQGTAAVIEFSTGKAILALTTLSFDILVLETLLPLVRGLKVVIAAEQQQRDPQLLAAKTAKTCVNIIQLTPSALKLLIDGNVDLTCLKNVETLLIGGERFPETLAHRLRVDYKGHIYNMYGPTETTVWSTIKKLTAPGKITIGTPIANTRVYITDRYAQLQPIGVVGELCLGGEGVTRGYLNNPGLTAERFCLRRPGALFKKTRRDSPGPRKNFLLNQSPLYQTGDLGRWLPAGDIEFLGRIDHQVKIRGFRIELGEIESRLSAHENIKDTVVTTHDDTRGDKYLCAYVVADKKPGESAISQLRVFLAQRLPYYMIPTYFVFLDAIPLTPNGKVDRKALPGPVPGISGAYIAPGDRTEQKLVEIWSDVLDLEKEKISIAANFFELGGHSLKATEMISKIHKELQVKLPLAQVFKTPDIKGISGYIRGMAKDKYVTIEPVEKKEYYPLSSIQKRFFTFQKLNIESTAYNIPIFLHLEGDLQQHKFVQVAGKLIHRHETLRTSFKIIGEEPIQQIHDHVEFEIEGAAPPPTAEEIRRKKRQKDTKKDEPKSRELRAKSYIKDFVRPFDPGQAPLLRLGFITLEEKKHILMFDLHHIVGDGTSLNLVIKDFSLFYTGREPGALKIQYKDFCEWQNQRLTSGKLKKHEEYWLNLFSGDLPLLNMPTDYPRPEFQSVEGNQIHFYFTGELTRMLKELMRDTGTTLYMVLLALYSILLNKYTLQEDIIVGTPISCRTHVDLENIIGLLIETITIRNYPQKDKPFVEYLEEVKENTLKAFENQAYPFRELVKQVGNENDRSRNPLFDAMLTVQNLEGSLPREEIEDIKLIPHEDVSYHDTKVDLSLTAREKEEKILFDLEYCTTLFKRETMERFIAIFKEITSTVVIDKQIKLKDIDISYDLVTAESDLYRETDNRFDF